MRRFLLVLLIFLIDSPCHTATLAEITWPTTGATSMAISSDGYFTRADVNSNAFEVYGGGPDGRNYLRIKNPGPGAFWLIRTEDTLGNPDIMVVRFWWRVGPNTEDSNRHNMVIDGTAGNMSAPNPGLWHQIARSGGGTGNTIDLGIQSGGDMEYFAGDYDNDGVWMNFTVNQWYLIEYRINKTNSSVEVRIDEVDQTSNFHRYKSGQQDISLADDNGSFNLGEPFNYFKLNTYDKETQTVGDMIEDYAGVMITDGPDWIGGGSGAGGGMSIQGNWQ